MKREKSIASFIEKLPMDGSVGNCESTLLVTDMAFMGGEASSNGECTNDSVEVCAGATNQDECTNYKGACDKSTNARKCTSTDIIAPPISKNPFCGHS